MYEWYSDPCGTPIVASANLDCLAVIVISIIQSALLCVEYYIGFCGSLDFCSDSALMTGQTPYDALVCGE